VAFVIGAKRRHPTRRQAEPTSGDTAIAILDVRAPDHVLFVKRAWRRVTPASENELFSATNTMMRFADAKKMVEGS